ncbi:hypothetical protein BX070DRAFT_30627 [Coemansia spiralis]|nr:hypothetical protein BX070DRAFT_30627 [Coemansia spiralis]
MQWVGIGMRWPGAWKAFCGALLLARSSSNTRLPGLGRPPPPCCFAVLCCALHNCVPEKPFPKQTALCFGFFLCPPCLLRLSQRMMERSAGRGGLPARYPCPGSPGPSPSWCRRWAGCPTHRSARSAQPSLAHSPSACPSSLWQQPRPRRRVLCATLCCYTALLAWLKARRGGGFFLPRACCRASNRHPRMCAWFMDNVCRYGLAAPSAAPSHPVYR